MPFLLNQWTLGPASPAIGFGKWNVTAPSTGEVTW